MSPAIYFVRHGETDWNKEGRLQGQRDVPLNPRGRIQAEEAARRVTELVSDPARLEFVASPLARTRDTMSILRGTLGLAPDSYRADERLKELTFGSWEGLTWREVRARDARLAAERGRDKWNFVPPGGGESYAALVARVMPAIAELERATLVVAHGGVARAFLATLAGLPPSRAAVAEIWQGRILLLENGRHAWH